MTRASRPKRSPHAVLHAHRRVDWINAPRHILGSCGQQLTRLADVDNGSTRPPSPPLPGLTPRNALLRLSVAKALRSAALPARFASKTEDVAPVVPAIPYLLPMSPV